METRESCPACGHPAVLLPLGTRYDRLHRWLPWTTTLTRLYLCEQCDALLEVRDTADGAAFSELGLA